MYTLLAKPLRAIEDLDEVIRLNPEYVDAYMQRGLAYRNLGQLQQAIENFDRAIEIDSKSAQAYCHKGNAHKDLYEHWTALQDYRLAVNLNEELASRQPKLYRLIADPYWPARCVP